MSSPVMAGLASGVRILETQSHPAARNASTIETVVARLDRAIQYSRVSQLDQ
jgi:hypothetical protein